MDAVNKKIVLKHPLFSRFLQEPRAGQDVFLSKDTLYRSILENLIQILDSRNFKTLSDPKVPLTSIDFGIPDITHGYDKNFDTNLEEHILAAITSLEPRLENVEVKVLPKAMVDTLELTVKANVVKEIYKDLTFILQIKHSGLSHIE